MSCIINKMQGRLSAVARFECDYCGVWAEGTTFSVEITSSKDLRNLQVPLSSRPFGWSYNGKLSCKSCTEKNNL